ncbi:MAG: AAA family ATPase, partial [Syntrophales bacterium]
MNNEIAKKFLNVLFGNCNGEGFIEFRFFPSKRRIWLPTDFEDLPAVPEGENIHMGVATRLHGKGTKSDLVEIPAVWIDYDFKDGSEKDLFEKLMGFPLKQSIIIRSGHGCHIYWLLKKPGTPGEIKRVENINRSLARHFNGDLQSAEAAHLLRLPGTKNYKYNPPKDVMLANIIAEREYELDDFENCLSELPDNSPKEIPVPGKNTDAWIVDAMKGVPQGQRNVTAAKLVGHYLSMGMRKSEIAATLGFWNNQNHPPLSENEIRGVVDSIENTHTKGMQKRGSQNYIYSPERVQELVQIIQSSVLGVDNFVQKEIPIRPFIMSPWLKPRTLTLVHAGAGVGKTFLCLAIALAITRGVSIGHWTVENPVGCLYIDGEMPTDTMQQRFKGLTKNLPEEKAPLIIMSADDMRRGDKDSPVIHNKNWQEAIYSYLEDNPQYRVLVLDNLMSLTPGHEEDTKLGWDLMNSWLLRLRSIGVAVIMVHHEGKDGTQRGTSSRVDNIDLSIRLTKPVGYKPQDGARFNVSLGKDREYAAKGADSFCFSITENDGGLNWTTGIIEKEKKS